MATFIVIQVLKAYLRRKQMAPFPGEYSEYFTRKFIQNINFKCMPG